MEVASSSSSASTSWISHLSVLPPRLRLEFQKTITNDITVQSTMPSQTIYSRGYSSLRGKIPGNGLGAIKPTILNNLKNAPGDKVKAIQRQFPSTAELLADMILQAAHSVKAKPIHPFVSPSASSSSSSNPVENENKTLNSCTVSSVTDQEYHGLVSELQYYGLDTSYRIPVCRNLQRRLLVPTSNTPTATNINNNTDYGWSFEGKNAERYPNALEISKGNLTQKVQSALDTVIQERTLVNKQQQQQSIIASINNNTTNNQGDTSNKKEVTSAPMVSSSTIDDADLALLDEAFDEL